VSTVRRTPCTVVLGALALALSLSLSVAQDWLNIRNLSTATAAVVRVLQCAAQESRGTRVTFTPWLLPQGRHKHTIHCCIYVAVELVATRRHRSSSGR